MRPGQQKQRGRGRNNSGGGSSGSNNNNSSNNNNQRKGQNPLTRTYDSSGPDVKIRGTAQHIAEKYMNLARDATSSGDRVMAENYLQHAEHYNRIIAAAQALFQERYQRDDRPEYSNERGDQGDQGDRGDMNDRDDRDEDDNNEGQQPSESENYNRQSDNYNRQSDSRERQQPDNRDRQQPESRERQPDNRNRQSESRERQSDNRDRQPENNNRQPDNHNRQQVVTEQPVIIDQSTPQPVFDETPAEVQIEQEAAAGEQPAATRRRSNAGRPRRTPRQPRGDAPAAEALAKPVEEPAE
jgi:hypothetical protein